MRDEFGGDPFISQSSKWWPNPEFIILMYDVMNSWLYGHHSDDWLMNGSPPNSSFSHLHILTYLVCAYLHYKTPVSSLQFAMKFERTAFSKLDWIKKTYVYWKYDCSVNTIKFYYLLILSRGVSFFSVFWNLAGFQIVSCVTVCVPRQIYVYKVHDQQ